MKSKMTKQAELISRFAIIYGQCIASDIEEKTLHVVRSSQGSWMETKLFNLVNKFNKTLKEN